ncbi:MAG: hypothetical protein NPIRA05_08070 [Nitrospirales bacterium]|nr:MAG: hypothetical protein NPIRA05_08070 [Nitrospirales bacterium]
MTRPAAMRAEPYNRSNAQGVSQEAGSECTSDSVFDRYSETFVDKLHDNIDFEQTARGYGEYYYDCLPEDRDVRILDVGCGTGLFLRFLEIQGYRLVEGLELSAQQAVRARGHVAFPVHVGNAATFLQERKESYAAITLNDVLEHVPKNKTVPFLQTLKKGLRADGVLVINVPNVAGLNTSFVRYNDFTHELVFTEMSLRQVLLMAGFRDIRFIPQQIPFKCTPRHVAYRLARWLWFRLVHLIYVVEMPGCKLPTHWQTRLVAVARSSD